MQSSARVALAVLLVASANLGCAASGDITGSFKKAPATESCPEGYRLVSDKQVCSKGAYALLQEHFCYGVPWEQAVQPQEEPSMPEGCYFSTAPPGGCGLYLNKPGNQGEAAAVPMGLTSIMRICERVAPVEQHSHSLIV
mmetsp:Transcript_63754/g.164139  ORF Transcript_63754/g.164139 Transcript_63754/m.164139 type:complete len:140 (-) Transcript_63754:109-528(-)